MSPIDDELTAVTRRPRRDTRALAVFCGLTTALGFGAGALSYRDLRERIHHAAIIGELQLDVDRGSNEAARSTQNQRLYELQIRVERLEQDNVECHAWVSLP